MDGGGGVLTGSEIFSQYELEGVGHTPLAQLHIHIYQIPKFQNNPSSGYWELVHTKFGRKEKEVEEEMEQKNISLPLSFGRLNNTANNGKTALMCRLIRDVSLHM